MTPKRVPCTDDTGGCRDVRAAVPGRGLAAADVREVGVALGAGAMVGGAPVAVRAAFGVEAGVVDANTAGKAGSRGGSGLGVANKAGAAGALISGHRGRGDTTRTGRTGRSCCRRRFDWCNTSRLSTTTCRPVVRGTGAADEDAVSVGVARGAVAAGGGGGAGGRGTESTSAAPPVTARRCRASSNTRCIEGKSRARSSTTGGRHAVFEIRPLLQYVNGLPRRGTNLPPWRHISTSRRLASVYRVPRLGRPSPPVETLAYMSDFDTFDLPSSSVEEPPVVDLPPPSAALLAEFAAFSTRSPPPQREEGVAAGPGGRARVATKAFVHNDPDDDDDELDIDDEAPSPAPTRPPAPHVLSPATAAILERMNAAAAHLESRLGRPDAVDPDETPVGGQETFCFGFVPARVISFFVPVCFVSLTLLSFVAVSIPTDSSTDAASQACCVGPSMQSCLTSMAPCSTRNLSLPKPSITCWHNMGRNRATGSSSAS